jgi:hypothetical protein
MHRKLLILMVLPLLLGIAVAFPPPERLPVRKGTAEDYWNGAAGVLIIDTHQRAWCLTKPINGIFLYSTGTLHGSEFHYVSADEVFADFPRTVDQLGGEDKRVLGWAAPGFRNWEQVDPQRTNPQLLILCLRETQQDWWARTTPVETRLFVTNADFDLGMAYQRMQLLPLIQIGEWGYMSALWVFLIWPWVRTCSLSRRAAHAALLPLLLLFPYYLGYCAWKFTSAGPVGGVIYPYVLDAFRWLPWTSIDRFLIQHVPQVFGPLTGPIGPILSMGGGRRAGPLAAIGLGLVFGTAVFCLGLLLRFRTGPTTQSYLGRFMMIWRQRG